MQVPLMFLLHGANPQAWPWEQSEKCFDEGMEPAGCGLRMHGLKSVDGAKLFPDHSVDTVFVVDGLHACLRWRSG
jgi:hypothetical protein